MTHSRSELSEARLLLAVGEDVGPGLAAALHAAGFQVTAAGADAALPPGFSPPPQMVLLDTERAGERDALGTCRAMRATPAGVDVPVLLLITANDAGVVERGLEAGVTDFGMRTSPPVLLAHRVRQMLRVKHTVDDLQRSESSLEHAQRIARLGNWAWDPFADVVTWSAEVQRLLEVPAGREEASISRFLSRVHFTDQPAAQAAIDGVVSAASPFALDVRYVLDGGTSRVLRAQGEPVLGDDGQVVRVIGTLQDITERTATEDRIRFLAYYDSLTSLPNRVLFTDRLRGMLGTARRRGQLVATIFVDLDNFKSVNDTMGHTAGDELLKAVAGRFRESLRDTDVFTRYGADGEANTVARLGGDEFILAIGDLDRVEDVPRIARRIQDALKQPIALSFGEMFVTTSMGISVFPQDGQTVEELFKNADAALYHAKDSGRNCFQFFSSSLNEAALQRLMLEAHLRRAVQNDELIAYFQPQVDGRTDAVVAVEALMRWNRPEAGLVSPAQFIHVAEESGSIHEMGRWILRAASAASVAHGWAARGVRVAVNLSASAVQAARRGRDAGRGGHRLGPEARVRLARDHRERARRPRPRRADAGRAQECRLLDHPRRLRHRLLVAHLPQGAAARRAEDRPLVHPDANHRPARHRHRHRNHRRGPQPQDGRRGRGGGAPGAEAEAARARLPGDAGLLVRAAGAGRADHLLMRRISAPAPSSRDRPAVRRTPVAVGGCSRSKRSPDSLKKRFRSAPTSYGRKLPWM